MLDRSSIDGVVGKQSSDVQELKGRHKSILASIDNLSRQLEQLNYGLSLKDDVNNVLSYILDGAQKATSGKYEKLLTALCQDILGTRISIKFITGTSRDRPTLDIKAVNDGKLEDIFDGRGGSVANIVSTGLRFIVLTRMQELRQFMVLDESDCWIRYEVVHKFASIVNQMSIDMGVQTLAISHHPKAVFGDVNIIKMDYEDAFNRVYVEEEEPFLWEDGQKGIRSIRLHNFMSHQATEIILSPKSNVIVGGNDIGKSAVVRALRAICYNEGSDDMIRHDTDKCRVILEIEDGYKIEWSRKSKGAHRTEYFMYDAEGNEVHHTVDGKDVPSWAAKALGIHYINKFDVQIGHQKKPLFLIDETGARRAEILSIGRDTQYIQSMCQGYAKKCAESKREANRIRKELLGLQRLNGNIEALVLDLSDSMGLIVEMNKKVSKALDGEKILKSFIEKLKPASVFMREVNSVESKDIQSCHSLEKSISLNSRPAVELRKIKSIDSDGVEPSHSILASVKSLSRSALNISSVEKVEMPEMNKSSDLYKSICKVSRENHNLSIIPSVNHTDMADNSSLTRFMHVLSRKQVMKINGVSLPDMLKTTSVSKCINKLHQLDEDVKPMTIKKEDLLSDIKKTEHEIHVVSERDGHCVLCGHDV